MSYSLRKKYGITYKIEFSVSARVDPGLVRTELGQFFDTRWVYTGLEMPALTVIVAGSVHTLS